MSHLRPRQSSRRAIHGVEMQHTPPTARLRRTQNSYNPVPLDRHNLPTEALARLSLSPNPRQQATTTTTSYTTTSPPTIYVVCSETGGPRQETETVIVGAFESLRDANRKAEALVHRNLQIRVEKVEMRWTDDGCLLIGYDGREGTYGDVWVKKLEVERPRSGTERPSGNRRAGEENDEDEEDADDEDDDSDEEEEEEEEE